MTSLSGAVMTGCMTEKVGAGSGEAASSLGSRTVRTVCTHCAVGCGILAEVENGVWLRQEIAGEHPVSSGGHCCKGAGAIDMVTSDKRLKSPMKTKLAAKASDYIRIRPGTDVAFTMGLVNAVVCNGWEDKEFIRTRVAGYDEMIAVAAHYTPEVVEDITGIPEAEVTRIAALLASHRPTSLTWCMGGTQHHIGSSITRSFCLLQLILGNIGKSGGGVNIFHGHDNSQGASDMSVSSESLPGYYPVGKESSWRHWSRVWEVDYEWLTSRFYNKEYMLKKGFTLARWYEGVLGEERIEQYTPIRAMIQWGCGGNVNSGRRENLLVADGSYPPGSEVEGGYPEFEEVVPGTNWATDISGRTAKEALDRGMAPFGNARARCLVVEFPDQVSVHREPLHSPRADLVAKYPTYEDQDGHFRVHTRYQSEQDPGLAQRFPYVLITGRMVEHMGSGAETGNNKYLAELAPDMYAEINPRLADNLGIGTGEMMSVESPEGGRITVKARVTERVDEKTIFLPYHFAGMFLGESRAGRFPPGHAPPLIGESANCVTNYGYDIVTNVYRERVFRRGTGENPWGWDRAYGKE